MLRRIGLASVIVAISLSCIVVQSFAYTYEVDTSDYEIIENSNEEFRVLFDFVLPEGFEDFNIEMAKVVLPFSAVDEDIETWLFPITTSWVSNNVDWDTPWKSAGGDYDDSLSVNMHMLRYDNEVSEVVVFTVTDVLQLIQNEEDEFGGLVNRCVNIRRPPHC